MKPISAEAPIRDRATAVRDAGADVGPFTSQHAQGDEAGEAMLRRHARRLALIFITLSAVFVFGVFGAVWFLLHG